MIVSDNLDHTKATIVAYIYKILRTVPKNISRVRMWTDGPTSQFKNKFIAATIKAFETKLKKKIVWNFHATAHGKSVVDGIGAVAKNKVRRLVKTRKSIINCAKDFVSSFNQETSNVEVIEVCNAEIDKINTNLKVDTIFTAAPNLKDITKFHQMQCVDNKVTRFLFSKDGYAKLKV